MIIPGSNVGSIAKHMPSCKISKREKQLLYTNFRGNATTRWGTLKTSVSHYRYIQRQSLKSPDITVQDLDLVICSNYPWLAASPVALLKIHSIPLSVV